MNLPVCHLLHWEHEKGVVPAVAEHRHAYFQIELCVRGAIRLRSGSDETWLNAGDWVLLPPETPHRMDYSGKDLEYYSLKFQVDRLGALPSAAVPVLHDPLAGWCIQTLRARHEQNAGSYQQIQHHRPVLEALLLVMLQHALLPQTGANPVRPKLLTTLRALVASEGAKVNVKYAAYMLHCSVSQLKYRYRLALPELAPAERCSLKQYLDRELQRRGDRYLFYSDLALARIAAETQFSNVYTFSRFCRRMTGCPPSVRRARRDGDDENNAAELPDGLPRECREQKP